jgi:hypothetical protein
MANLNRRRGDAAAHLEVVADHLDVLKICFKLPAMVISSTG